MGLKPSIWSPSYEVYLSHPLHAVQLPRWDKSERTGVRHCIGFLEQRRPSTSTPSKEKGSTWSLRQVNGRGRGAGRQAAADTVSL